MRAALSKGAALLLSGISASGCPQDELSGFAFSVRLQTERDTCLDPPAQYDETLEFVLRFDGGSAVSVGTDGAVFATGEIAGCQLTYQTGAWEEDRGGGPIRWELDGLAQYRFGGTGCEMTDGLDWEGSEVFTVLSSEDPSVPTGCTSELRATGTYLGER